jgi:SNF2 family DNA or RNA helicase
MNANKLTLDRIIATANLKELNVAQLLKAETSNKAKSKSSFEVTFEFARLVSKSATYFKTKECKANLSAIGVEWKLEDFFNNLGAGFTKQYCYRLIKAVKLEFKTIEKDGVEIQTSNLQAYLDSSVRFSIEEFTKFAKDEPTKDKAENKLSLTFGKATLKVTDKDELITKMTRPQIEGLINLLNRKLSTMVEA